MEYHINPEYHHLAEFVNSVPDHNYTVEHIYCNHRNTVEKVTYDGKCYVVKKFKRPTWANQVIYTFFRKNKARRAFDYALRLREESVETASPVAYIIQNKYGLFHTAWFISEYLPYETLKSKVRHTEDVAEKERIVEAFIRFTAQLHCKGIRHKDYNPANLLVHTVDGEYRFALIDINQMQFGSVPGVSKSVISFIQSGLDMKYVIRMVNRYSDIRGISSALCRLSCYRYKLISSIRRTLKIPLKMTLATLRSING